MKARFILKSKDLMSTVLNPGDSGDGKYESRSGGLLSSCS